MPRLSEAQRRLLERMRDGKNIGIDTHGVYFSGAETVRRGTFRALATANYIRRSSYSTYWYEITNLGRDALARARQETRK